MQYDNMRQVCAVFGPCRIYHLLCKGQLPTLDLDLDLDLGNKTLLLHLGPGLDYELQNVECGMQTCQ
jgi:hypothetical protein